MQERGKGVRRDKEIETKEGERKPTYVGRGGGKRWGDRKDLYLRRQGGER